MAAESQTAGERHASRVLNGVVRMSYAASESDLAVAMADAMREASGCGDAVTMLVRSADGSLVPAAWRIASEMNRMTAVLFHGNLRVNCPLRGSN